MKNQSYILFLFTALFAIILTSCNKDSTPEELTKTDEISMPDEASKLLFGQWVYQSNSGGFSGNGGSNQFNANSWVEFSNKGVYNVYDGNIEKQKLNFTISTYVGFFKYKINFTENFDFNYTYVVENDKLHMSENVADGFEYVFVRK